MATRPRQTARVELQEVLLLASVVHLGTLDSTGPGYAFLRDGVRVVAHVGLATKGQNGATSALTIAEPDDAQDVPDHTSGMAGFFDASSMERLPTEVAITEDMRRFKRLARAAAAT